MQFCNVFCCSTGYENQILRVKHYYLSIHFGDVGELNYTYQPSQLAQRFHVYFFDRRTLVISLMKIRTSSCLTILVYSKLET